MQNKNSIIISTLIVILILIAGAYWFSAQKPDTNKNEAIESAEAEASIRSQIEKFGHELRNVSLLAPANILQNDLESHYGSYVTPELLAMWQKEPSKALGREVSSPYPDRIEIASITRETNDQYEVKGNVVEMTNADSNPVATYPITLTVVERSGSWLISKATKGQREDTEVKNLSNAESFTVEGVWECLPHRDTSGPITLECAFGIKANTGEHYALNLDGLAEKPIDFPTNTSLKVTGTLIPKDENNSSTWNKYLIAGIVKVKSIERQ
jgi:hypothetical protein